MLTPATRALTACLRLWRRPLNKGRGITPGYTTKCSVILPSLWSAQQRPRYHPRLHLQPDRQEGAGECVAQQRPRYHPRLHRLVQVCVHCHKARSTKAEVSPPATLGRTAKRCAGVRRSTKAEVSPPATRNRIPSVTSPRERAQQRPRYHPRLHPWPALGSPERIGRSTKAEVSPPATPWEITQGIQKQGSLNKGRGITPGYTSRLKAFLGVPLRAQQRPRYHPRLHMELCHESIRIVCRSTKAEVSPPATHSLEWGRLSSHQARSTKAEVSPPATHPAGPFQFVTKIPRSTKAEVSPPATRKHTCTSRGTRGSLNKGRGITPGYTKGTAWDHDSRRSLNKGRGITPGYT